MLSYVSIHSLFEHLENIHISYKLSERTKLKI
jgi:hypothetical protein